MTANNRFNSMDSTLLSNYSRGGRVVNAIDCSARVRRSDYKGVYVNDGYPVTEAKTLTKTKYTARKKTCKCWEEKRKHLKAMVKGNKQ